jgi:hypothetical protein
MQSVNITNTPTPPQGHEAAMVAKADASAAAAAAAAGANPPAPPVAERPAHIPEKFWDAEKGEVRLEDLAKSYAALEAKQGTGKPPAAPAPGDAPAAPDAGAAAATKAGLDLSALETEYRTNGTLSAENMAKLNAAGFSETDVADYIAGREARVAQFESGVMEAVPGGAERYSEMMEWAKVNLTPAEIAAYNKAMDSGDLAQAKLAAAGVGVRFTAAVGTEPNLVAGRTSAAASADVYESMAQVTADMKDPRYEKDPAFRAKVQAKVGRSNL